MFNQEQRLTLLKLARDSITSGVLTGSPLNINSAEFSPPLTETRASFVTLEIDHRLRGCIGSLEARRPLVEDIAENSWAAAFSDPRFTPVTHNELETITLHLSILSKAEPLKFNSEPALIKQLQPHIDGLIIEDRGRRATFLPSVWESLTDPKQFLAHLKQKAGLPADYWSDSLKAYRYTTESFGE